MIDLDNIQKLIGYKFNNPSLCERAFTHPSADRGVLNNYQTVEFLGDSILDFIVADELMRKYPDADEGELTKLRANIVSETPLSQVIDKVRLTEFMVFGVGEARNRIYKNNSIKADLFEAILGAIYLDGGIDRAREYVVKFLKELIDGAMSQGDNQDAKSRLNEYGAKHSKSVEYKLLSTKGPDHKPVFEFGVYVDGELCGSGRGASKHEAQQIAAENALQVLS